MMEIRVLTQLPARQNRVPLSSWPPHGHDPDAGRCVRWSVLWGAGCTGVIGAPVSPPPAGFHYESNNETDKREFEKAVETIAVSFSST